MTSPAFGDIVEIAARQDSVRWVLAPSGSPSPSAIPYVRLLRHDVSGNCQSHTVYPNEVSVMERPTWAIGEKVFIGGREASIIALSDETARVLYAPRSLPLGKTGLTHRDEGGESDIPIWRLSLDNRLHQGEPA